MRRSRSRRGLQQDLQAHERARRMTHQDQPLPVPSRRFFFFAGEQFRVAQEVKGGQDVGDLGGVRIGRREAVLDDGEREVGVLEQERDEVRPKVGFVLCCGSPGFSDVGGFLDSLSQAEFGFDSPDRQAPPIRSRGQPGQRALIPARIKIKKSLYRG